MDKAKKKNPTKQIKPFLSLKKGEGSKHELLSGCGYFVVTMGYGLEYRNRVSF